MKASIAYYDFVFMSSECHAVFLKVKDITYEKYLAFNMGWNAAFNSVSFQTPTTHLSLSLVDIFLSLVLRFAFHRFFE